MVEGVYEAQTLVKVLLCLAGACRDGMMEVAEIVKERGWGGVAFSSGDRVKWYKTEPDNTPEENTGGPHYWRFNRRDGKLARGM